MKILKLLNKFFIIFFTLCFFLKISSANEPIDIWKIEKINNSNKNVIISDGTSNSDTIQGVKIEQQNENIIINQELDSSEIKLAGLYDPAENGLTIDMWTNSNGIEIKNLLENISPENLSDFSERILDIALLTNSYFPSKNIEAQEFIDFKFKYLIKKKDFDLIKRFLIKNPSLKNNHKLVRYYADYYLSISQLDKSCEIFEQIDLINDDYLTNFKIYCLLYQNKKEEAQLLFDLKSELESLDNFFVNKFNFLMGYEIKEESLSDENILYFHLSHKTIENFEYKPQLDTPKFIWKYLSFSNLLKGTDSINIEDIEQVRLIEKATSEEAYDEKELLNLYKKFQFDINQLLDVDKNYKLLPDFKARALLYQRLLLTADTEQKLILLSKLKKLFDKSKLTKAFDDELSNILMKIDEEEVPSNFTTFYKNNKEKEKIKESKIKFNNKIIHQSKLLNYFLNKTSLPKIEKETNDLLRKIKKNKKYSFSNKDILMLESLKSDGVKISKKYNKLYDHKSNLPAEINSLIINGETGIVLLKLVEIIGKEEVENLDTNSITFLVEIMNELKIVNLRNEILLKVLPLKV
tara:strand:- start:1004 stop:2740 length:1737 start_codon:yes stop_codon:yes gene_type:complete